MINLRYHIVSLTAVFLAIGIGLTLGSTFLDRATVDNLNGQLENLEGRLEERDREIDQLQNDLERSEELQAALDDQGAALLTDRIDDAPVVVIAAEGVEGDDVDHAVRSLEVAGADVHGLWWLTDRFLLDDEAEVADLAAALEEESNDPARLRRLALDGLGGELREHQSQDAPGDGPGTDAGSEGDTVPGETTTTSVADADAGAPGDVAPPPGADGEPPAGTDDDGTTDDATTEGATDDAATGMAVSESLIEAGFITFEPVGDGPEQAVLPPGVRLVIVGGSAVVPDDVLVEPLVDGLARGATEPLLTVVTSAMVDSAEMSEVVAVVRDDDRLRSVISTVDALDHFQGWMATVLAVADLDEGVIGHYGLGEGASALLPPPPTS